MTQSSCKGDTKSKSHTSVKLAPVRVFSCKHPISSRNVTLMRDPMSKRQKTERLRTVGGTSPRLAVTVVLCSVTLRSNVLCMCEQAGQIGGPTLIPNK